MKAMKKILFSLVVLLVSQVMSGQTGYETLLRAITLADRGEAEKAAALLAGTDEINGDVR